MKLGVKGVAFLQVWLLIFGVVGFIFMMGVVSGGGDGRTHVPVLMLSSLGGSHGGTLHSTLLNEEKSKNTNNEVVVRNVENKDSYLSNLFKLKEGGGPSALVSGLEWAGIAYYTGTMIGGMFGIGDDNSEALSTALAAGAGVYRALDTYTASGKGIMSKLSGNAGMIGVGVGVLIFALMYKKTRIKTVEFTCLPWKAPRGGNNCEVCNEGVLPCSDYRCRSLGESCEIVNAGSEDEKCVYVNPKDVNPPVIRPDYERLSRGHRYENVKNSPPGPGFDIVYDESDDGCLKAFTPLEFGLITDEPAQCKIDFNHSVRFDDMRAFVGGSNLYLYNHSERFSLPSAAAIKNSSMIIENGKDLTFFVRCRDKNGNENEAEYAVHFCVDPMPDTTVPLIKATSVRNGGCVAEGSDYAEVRFYTNEPSNCRWSNVDQAFDSMNNKMVCSNDLYQINAAQLFTCIANLSGIVRDGSKFFVRCEDLAEDRNVMKQSYEFSLRGSSGLVMKNLRPNDSISGSVNPLPVELYVETLFGCNMGRAVCSWSDDGDNFIQFFDTNKADGIHTQRLDLGKGNYKYNVKCIDEGGNLVEDSVSFSVDIDSNPPMIARVYEENEMLKVVTARDSECSYSFDSCDFEFSDGVEMPYGNTSIHVAEWNKDKIYYIKCRDEYIDASADCSIVVRPTSNFL